MKQIIELSTTLRFLTYMTLVAALLVFLIKPQDFVFESDESDVRLRLLDQTESIPTESINTLDIPISYDSRIILGKGYAFGWNTQMNNRRAAEWLECHSWFCTPGEAEYYIGLTYFMRSHLFLDYTTIGYYCSTPFPDFDAAIYWMKKSKEQGYGPAASWLQSTPYNK